MKFYSKLPTVSIPEQSLQQITDDIDDISNVYPLNRWSFHYWGFSSAKRLESRSVIRFCITRTTFARKSCFLLPTSRQQFDCPHSCTRFHTLPPAPARAVRPTLVPSWKSAMRQVVSTYLPPRNSSNILSGIARPVHEDHPFDWLATKIHSTRQTILVLLPQCQWHQQKPQKLICLIPRGE